MFATDTNFSAPAAPPQPTAVHPASEAEDCAVHVTPSTEVITRFPVPVLDTATNRCCPTGPPQATEFHAFHWIAAGTDTADHDTPSVEVIT